VSTPPKKSRDAIRDALEEARPAHEPPSYLFSQYVMRPDGLYKKARDGGRDIWISTPFKIEAETHDGDHDTWGVLLSWHDRNGVKREEVFDRGLFAGECGDLTRRLANGGLTFDTGSAGRQALAGYLNLASSTQRARVVSRVGWHVFGKDRVFVLPGRTFGEVADRVVWQTGERDSSVYQSAGTLAEWRERVSRLCVGNSRLLLAVSCAFGGPLLGLLGEDGGGFHFRGNSRSGKTTALKVAASVCGGSPSLGAGGFVRQWRATSNGLEGIAGQHCDALLAIDEMS
jgi:uncharacterized protein (DUF927 family)